MFKRRIRGKKMVLDVSRNSIENAQLVLFRRVRLKAKSGEIFEGEVLDADEERLIIEVHEKTEGKAFISYVIMDWENIQELVTVGWAREWKKVMNVFL